MVTYRKRSKPSYSKSGRKRSSKGRKRSGRKRSSKGRKRSGRRRSAPQGYSGYQPLPSRRGVCVGQRKMQCEQDPQCNWVSSTRSCRAKPYTSSGVTYEGPVGRPEGYVGGKKKKRSSSKGRKRSSGKKKSSGRKRSGKKKASKGRKRSSGKKKASKGRKH